MQRPGCGYNCRQKGAISSLQMIEEIKVLIEEMRYRSVGINEN